MLERGRKGMNEEDGKVNNESINREERGNQRGKRERKRKVKGKGKEEGRMHM